jgi:tetrapyrrole methylase family protein/MazG family protein/ATP diphosphatase
MNNYSNIEGVDRLSFIVKALRGSHGCPWDRKQTPESLKKYLLEETQELAEAIDEGEPNHICEEIGDLYFILTLLAEIYEEQGTFSSGDAWKSINEKMIRRHPHVFDRNHVSGREKDLRRQWEQIKEQAKKDSGSCQQ